MKINYRSLLLWILSGVTFTHGGYTIFFPQIVSFITGKQILLSPHLRETMVIFQPYNLR